MDLIGALLIPAALTSNVKCMEAKMIETPRLLLREFEPTDRMMVIELLRDSEFMAYSPTGAMSYELAESRFQNLLDSYKKYGIGKFALIEKHTEEFIGYCGLENFSYK